MEFDTEANSKAIEDLHHPGEWTPLAEPPKPVMVSKPRNKGFWIARREKFQKEKWDPNWRKYEKDLWFVHGSRHWFYCATLGQFFSRTKKIRRQTRDQERATTIKNVIIKGPTRRIKDWESVVWPNDQEHQTDRLDELMTKSMLSALRRPEKLRSSQGMSHDWIWQHTGANFSKAVLKNFEGEAA